MNKIRGIILAGGHGNRLYPLTKTSSKQLLPIYDKPMIYYPLSILMLSGIRDIAIVSQSKNNSIYRSLFGNGSDLGINLRYFEQKKPKGIPEVYKITKNFIKNTTSVLILGDNIFYGDSLINKNIIPNIEASKNTIFAYPVSNPNEFGVVSLSKNSSILAIEEKPRKPKSNLAITGMYIFDSEVISIAENLKPSKRGETEIIDVINHYNKKNKLSVELLGRGIAWLDTGSPSTLNEASQFIQTIEKRQGLKIACIEEIAYRMNFISKKKLDRTISKIPNSSYKDYLSDLIKNN